MKLSDFSLEDIHFTPAVVGYLQTDTHVWLGERKSSSLGLGLGLLAGVGGKVGDEEAFTHETAAEAMIRETREEIAVHITGMKEVGRVRFIFPHKPKWTMDTGVYLIDAWDGTPQETSSTIPHIYPKGAVPYDRMWADNKLWLPYVLVHKKVYATILYESADKVADIDLRVEE